MLNFKNRYIQKIYTYIFINDGYPILIKEIQEVTKISRPTIRKYIRWLIDRGIIKKEGKRFTILPS